MDILYEEWLPAAQLAGLVTAHWRVFGDGANHPPSSVLPDGHVELVFNLGERVSLAGPAFTGDQPARAVVGPLSKALQLKYHGSVHTFGIRFHPARGAGYFGKNALDLTDQLLPLAGVAPVLDRRLGSLFADQAQTETAEWRAALDRVLIEHLPSALPPDEAVVALVDRLLQAESTPPVSQIAQELNLSPRQLHRRFLAAVGLPPKRFLRVLRFARVWQLASMRPRETWAALALDHGFADQAHLVREFRAFGAEPPTHVFTSDWYDTTEMSRVSGPAPGVRSVQDERPDAKV